MLFLFRKKLFLYFKILKILTYIKKEKIEEIKEKAIITFLIKWKQIKDI